MRYEQSYSIPDNDVETLDIDSPIRPDWYTKQVKWRIWTTMSIPFRKVSVYIHFGYMRGSHFLKSLRFHFTRLSNCISNIFYALKSSLLTSGKYIYLFNGKPTLIHCEYLNEFLGEKDRRLIVTLKIGNRWKNDIFEAHCLLFTHNADKKFINYDTKEILTVYSDENKKKTPLKREHFMGKLSQTYLRTIEYGDVDRYINYVERKYWSAELVIRNYTQMLEDLAKYISQEEQRGSLNEECISSELHQTCTDKLYDRLGSILKIQKLFGARIPTFYLPCDFHFGNVLYSEDNLYYIDFEYAREEVFLYDIYNIIYVDFCENKSSLLLNMYIEGNLEVISPIRKFFQAANVDFLYDKRKDYLYIFLIRKITFDIINTSKTKSGRNLELYCSRLLDKVESIVGYVNNKKIE